MALCGGDNQTRATGAFYSPVKRPSVSSNYAASPIRQQPTRDLTSCAARPADGRTTRDRLDAFGTVFALPAAASPHGLECRASVPTPPFTFGWARPSRRDGSDLFLADIRFNIYPLILSALHSIGLGWESAGVVGESSFPVVRVLPLYGWVRRAFDGPTALGAGFLYAVHPGLVRWSVEIIRDSTFWFLLAASVYLLWRATTEFRWRWYLAAGAAIALACLTRH